MAARGDVPGAVPAGRGGYSTSRGRGGYGIGGSRSGAGTMARQNMADNSHHAGPWLVGVVVLIVGIALHAFTVTTAATLMTLGFIALGTAGLIWSCWETNRNRSPVARWHTVITVGLTGFWLMLCTVTGFVTIDGWENLLSPTLHPLTMGLFLIDGVALAAAWNNRISVRYSELREAEIAATAAARAGDDDPWSEAGHPGVTAEVTRVDQYMSRGTLKLKGKGNTLGALQNNLAEIELAHNWPLGSVSITPVAGKGIPPSRRAAIRVMHDDPLKNPIPWPGLRIESGQSPFTPIPRGRRADGKPSFEVLAVPEGAQNTLIVGTNGAGKTAGEVPTLITAAAIGVDLILIDTVKAVQSYGDYADIFQLFVTDDGTARALLERIMSHTVRARTEHLAGEGLKAWSPKSSLRFMQIQLEEASFLSDASTLVDLAKTVRSVGIRLVLSLQRCTYDQMPPTLREQLPTTIHYGILTPGDARFALPEEVCDGGANPGKWRNKHPGMSYIAQWGEDLDVSTLETRTYDDPARTDPGHADGFAASARRVGAALHTMCPVTAASLGPLWTSRIPPRQLVDKVLGTQRAPQVINPANQNGATAVTTTTTSGQPPQFTGIPSPDPAGVIDGEAEEIPPTPITADGSRIVFGGDGLPPQEIDLGENPDPDIQADPHRPLRAPDPEFGTNNLAQPLRPRKVGEPNPEAGDPEEYATAMHARLRELIDGNQGQPIIAKDFEAVYQEFGFTRPTVYAWLARWSAPGREGGPLLTKLTGKGYLPVRYQDEGSPGPV